MTPPFPEPDDDEQVYEADIFLTDADAEAAWSASKQPPLIFARVARNLVESNQASTVLFPNNIVSAERYMEDLIFELIWQYATHGGEPWFREHFKEHIL